LSAESGRVAIITGGVRGIGRALADDLVARGWRVAVCYRTSVAAAEAYLLSTGPQGLAQRCDVRDPEAARDFVRAVAGNWNRVDAVINAVGPVQRVDLLDETPEGWRAMFAGNLDSVFYVTRAAVPIMTAQGHGRIVNFALVNADHVAAQPGLTAHFIAKLGVLVLTRSYARVLGAHGITVNAVSPGFVDTGEGIPEEFQRMAARVPAGYVGTPDDVVGAVRFLLSDEARYVNGANLQVSGGWGL
jgi:3-oxoacyl-[acyl-carrier protein] reductase